MKKILTLSFALVLFCSFGNKLLAQSETFDDVQLTGTDAFQPFLGFTKSGSTRFFIDGLEDNLAFLKTSGGTVHFMRIFDDALDNGLVLDGSGAFINDKLRVVNGGAFGIREVIAMENNGGSTLTFTDSSNGSRRRTSL